ncbi:MAG: GNAT family N-acetyltransferase [Oscillospiraceae bacterium]|nr:GNAT family N-acetyltransferase [Oscillospiraceae bacterium]
MLTHIGTQPIETERLLLRPFQMEDAPAAWANWAGDEASQRLLCEPVYATLEETQELLRHYIGQYDCADRTRYRWAIIEKASGECIGQVAYFLVHERYHFGELEYCVGRAYRRRGYCTEAVRAVMAYGFGQVHFHKIQVSHMEGNEASRGVILKCGFRYDATLRDCFYIDGAYCGRAYYSMLEGEWKNA